jgi:hypothetical protein
MMQGAAGEGNHGITHAERKQLSVLSINAPRAKRSKLAPRRRRRRRCIGSIFLFVRRCILVVMLARLRGLVMHQCRVHSSDIVTASKQAVPSAATPIDASCEGEVIDSKHVVLAEDHGAYRRGPKDGRRVIVRDVVHSDMSSYDGMHRVWTRNVSARAHGKQAWRTAHFGRSNAVCALSPSNDMQGQLSLQPNPKTATLSRTSTLRAASRWCSLLLLLHAAAQLVLLLANHRTAVPDEVAGLDGELFTCAMLDYEAVHVVHRGRKQPCIRLLEAGIRAFLASAGTAVAARAVTGRVQRTKVQAVRRGRPSTRGEGHDASGAIRKRHVSMPVAPVVRAHRLQRRAQITQGERDAVDGVPRNGMRGATPRQCTRSRRTHKPTSHLSTPSPTCAAPRADTLAVSCGCESSASRGSRRETSVLLAAPRPWQLCPPPRQSVGETSNQRRLHQRHRLLAILPPAAGGQCKAECWCAAHLRRTARQDTRQRAERLRGAARTARDWAWWRQDEALGDDGTASSHLRHHKRQQKHESVSRRNGSTRAFER